MAADLLDTLLLDVEDAWQPPLTGKRRHPIVLQVFCRPTVGDCRALGPLRTRNISLGGIAFLAPAPIAVGTHCCLEVHNQAEVLLPGLSARVVHATGQKSGDWLVGCEFLLPLEERILRQIIML